MSLRIPAAVDVPHALGMDVMKLHSGAWLSTRCFPSPGEADGTTGSRKDGEEMSPKTSHDCLRKATIIKLWSQHGFSKEGHIHEVFWVPLLTHAETQTATVKTGVLDS